MIPFTVREYNKLIGNGVFIGLKTEDGESNN